MVTACCAGTWLRVRPGPERAPDHGDCCAKGNERHDDILPVRKHHETPKALRLWYTTSAVMYARLDMYAS